MAHLTPDQLVDAAEGSAPESAFPHLQSCGRCREELAELRAALASIEPDAVPEPSPLFWPHLSSRVREVIEEDAGQPLAASSPRWLPRLLISALACGAMLIVAATLRVGDWSRESSRPVVAAGGEVFSGASTDDPSFGLVSALTADLDWDTVHDSGFVAHNGMVDRAVSALSADERVELAKLLNDELAEHR